MSTVAGILLAASVAAVLAACVLLIRGTRYRPTQPLQLVVADRVDHDEHLFTLALRRPWHQRFRPLPRFGAGQSVAVGIPGAPLTRRYSLARWQARPWCYQLTVRREADGRFSPRLWAHARRGARLEVGVPTGSFVLDTASSRRRAVMIAGGVGITPLLAMVDRWAGGAGGYAELHLYWQVRRPWDAMYAAFLGYLASRNAAFRFRLLVSRPSAGVGERIDVALLRTELGELGDADFYLCAGAALLDPMLAALAQAGVVPDALRHERFAAPSVAAGADWRVVYGERVFSFAGHRTLLEAFEAEGLAIDSDCRNGSCGRCRLKVCLGRTQQVMAPEHALPEGQVLACCTQPASDLMLATAE